MDQSKKDMLIADINRSIAALEEHMNHVNGRMIMLDQQIKTLLEEIG